MTVLSKCEDLNSSILVLKSPFRNCGESGHTVITEGGRGRIIEVFNAALQILLVCCFNTAVYCFATVFYAKAAEIDIIEVDTSLKLMKIVLNMMYFVFQMMNFV